MKNQIKQKFSDTLLIYDIKTKKQSEQVLSYVKKVGYKIPAYFGKEFKRLPYSKGYFRFENYCLNGYGSSEFLEKHGIFTKNSIIFKAIIKNKEYKKITAKSFIEKCKRLEKIDEKNR